MAITRAAGFPTNNQTSATAPAASWVTVGDLAVIQISSFVSSAKTISGISSTKATGWTQVIDAADATDNFSISIWVGTITATGADTITVTWTGGAPTAGNFETVCDELNSGLGATNVWAVVTNGSLRGTGAASNLFPSLTSGLVTLEAYWGYQIWSVSATGGTGTGFTFTVTGTSNLITFNGGLATSTAFQPSGSGTGGPTWAAAGIVSAALPGASSPTRPPVVPAYRRIPQAVRRWARTLTRAPIAPQSTPITLAPQVHPARSVHLAGRVLLRRSPNVTFTGPAPPPDVTVRPLRPNRGRVVQTQDQAAPFVPPAIPPTVNPQVRTRGFHQAGRTVTTRAPQPPQGARGAQPVVSYVAASQRALTALRRGRVLRPSGFTPPPPAAGVQPMSLFAFAVGRLFSPRHGPNAGRIIVPQTPQPLPPVVIIASGRIPSLPFQGSQPTVASGRGG